MKNVVLKVVKDLALSSLKRNANTTSSGWTFQPRIPAKLKNFKKN